MRFISTLALILMLPSAAFAQLPTAGEAMGTNDTAAAVAAETEYDFEGDHVKGNPIRPLGDEIGGEQHARTSSLIQVRQNFVPEMIKSVENI